MSYEAAACILPAGRAVASHGTDARNIVRIVPVTGDKVTTTNAGVTTIKLTAGQASVGTLFGEKSIT